VRFVVFIDRQEAYKKMSRTSSKSELAKELGIKVPEDGYWGNMSSRVCGLVGGAVGGNLVKDAIRSYEVKLATQENTIK
jgi:hypothetical protein